MKTNDCNLCEKRKVCKYVDKYKDTINNIEDALKYVEQCIVVKVEVKCSEYKEELRLTIQDMDELLKNINKNTDCLVHPKPFDEVI